MRVLVCSMMAVAALMASGAGAAPLKSVLEDGIACKVSDGKACKVGSFCRREFGACVAVPKGEGVCTPIPDICSDEVRPVCGCDGKTYANPCLAEIDDASLAHEGSCNSTDLGLSRQ